MNVWQVRVLPSPCGAALAYVPEFAEVRTGSKTLKCVLHGVQSCM